MLINKNLTSTNFKIPDSRTVKYIVLHYTGNNGDTAKANTKYFKSTYRGASAHYFVDENEVWQCVEDHHIAWHCGDTQKYTNGGATLKGKATNTNSIGVEMCSDKVNGVYIITEKTIENTVKLVQYLMEKHSVPAENVVRHFDVTGKLCPFPYVDHTKWQELKERICGTVAEEKIYNKLEEFNEEYQQALKWAIDKGILKGNGSGLALTKSEAKGIVFLYRFGMAHECCCR